MARCLPSLCAGIGWLLLPVAVWGEETKGDDFFEKQVRPVLATYCLECHGPQKQKGGLRLDSREAVLKGGDSGPAIVPGKPNESLLVTAVHYEKELQMPPKGRLKVEQVAALTTWVKSNAPWPKTESKVRTVVETSTFKITEKDRAFWAFQPVKPASGGRQPPVVELQQGADAPRSPVDCFVLAKLQEAGLQPSPRADK